MLPAASVSLSPSVTSAVVSIAIVTIPTTSVDVGRSIAWSIVVWIVVAASQSTADQSTSHKSSTIAATTTVTIVTLDVDRTFLDVDRSGSRVSPHNVAYTCSHCGNSEQRPETILAIHCESFASTRSFLHLDTHAFVCRFLIAIVARFLNDDLSATMMVSPSTLITITTTFTFELPTEGILAISRSTLSDSSVMLLVSPITPMMECRGETF
jgi:hypothetical protein